MDVETTTPETTTTEELPTHETTTETAVEVVTVTTTKIRASVSATKAVAASKKCIYTKKFNEGEWSLDDVLARWNVDTVLQAYWPDPTDDLMNGGSKKVTRTAANTLSAVRADTDRLTIKGMQDVIQVLKDRLEVTDKLLFEVVERLQVLEATKKGKGKNKPQTVTNELADDNEFSGDTGALNNL